MIKLLHVKSYSHSGSTLLNLLLAENKGVFAGGHLFRYAYLWNEADKRELASGELIQDFEFWRAVKQRMADKDQTPDFDESNSNIQSEHLANLCIAIQDESECALICDNSKARSFDDIVYKQPFDSFMVHLIRDGRAVYNSLRKKNIPRATTPYRWMIMNLFLWLKNRNKPNYICLRYEDIITDKDKVIDLILTKSAAYYGLSKDDLKNKGSTTIPLMFAGNRMRNDYNGEIKYDVSYAKALPFMTWAYLSLVMLPGLLAFKFPLTRKKLLSNA